VTKKIWLNHTYNRGVHREHLNITVSGEVSCDQSALARDSLCVLDEYEMVLAQLATVKAELAAAWGVIDAARVLLGSLPGTSDKDELRFRSALTNALAALGANIGELK